MKLSERSLFYMKLVIDPTGVLGMADAVSEIEKLEADSQMLDFLIQVMQEYANLSISYNAGQSQYKFNNYTIGDKKYCLSSGATPREAIAAAIKEWEK